MIIWQIFSIMLFCPGIRRRRTWTRWSSWWRACGPRRPPWPPRRRPWPSKTSACSRRMCSSATRTTRSAPDWPQQSSRRRQSCTKWSWTIQALMSRHRRRHLPPEICPQAVKVDHCQPLPLTPPTHSRLSQPCSRVLSRRNRLCCRRCQ